MDIAHGWMVAGWEEEVKVGATRPAVICPIPGGWRIFRPVRRPPANQSSEERDPLAERNVMPDRASWSSTRSLAVMLLTAVWMAAPGRVLAQRVRGTVTSAENPQPTGAIVTLEDASGEAVGRALTHADGTFVLTAPTNGRFRLRAIRLGFRPSPWETIDVGPAGVDGIRLEMRGVPVRLERVAVSAAGECTTRPDSAAAAFALWQAAETALLSSSVAQNDSRLGLLITTYQRSLDVPTGRVLRLQQTTRTGNTRRPFGATLTPVEFARRGFVEREPDGGVIYRAPDADVLLSAEFLDSHCFSVSGADAAHSGETGLKFEPTRSRRDLSDVRGTLWLDDLTSELRSLEWSYTNIEAAAANAGAGGRLTFARLPSGIWVVGSWLLRMPVVSERRSSIPSAGTSLGTVSVRSERERIARSIQEVGGIVVSVRDQGRELWPSRAGQRTMRLLDSDSRQPLAGAHVELFESGLETVSDSQGSIVLPYVLVGRYHMGVVRPSLAAVGVAFESILAVREDRVEPSELAVPNDDAVLSLACVGKFAGPARAVVNGVVVANDGAAPDHVVRVRATSRGEMQGIGSRGAATTVRAVWTTTDEFGRFHLCGLPWDEDVIVQAPDEAGQPGERIVPRRDGPARLDIVLKP